MMGTLTPSEEAQLQQTIEMFEVITQSQPHDYQSLEILKEAYFKLSRDKDVVNTSKRIAQAYVQLGQLSSAILEYETILQRFPDDPDVRQALAEIENKANSLSTIPAAAEVDISIRGPGARAARRDGGKTAAADVDDGRQVMHKIFVDSKTVSAVDFDACWPNPSLVDPPVKVVDPFIQTLAERGITPIDKSLRLICDRSRMAYLPLERYDVDLELARSFPADTCRRWCILPFDRLSKSVMVATTNPFNRQASKELETVTRNRLLWYIASPTELGSALKRVFR